MDILYRSAFELAAAIKSGKITSAQVLEFFLDRVDKFNPALNCVVVQDRDRARLRAKAADTAVANGEDWGPLHGVPMTIKDAYATEGIVTTDGIPEYKGYVPKVNADGVQRYIDAGAIIFGKTNVPLNSADLQSYNVIYGQTNNPWDVSRTCGGSSGGAAAALAAGLTPLELGSDIGGSIRTPAQLRVATYFEDANVELDAESKVLLEATATSLEKMGAQVSRNVKPDFDTADNHEVYLGLLIASMSVGMPEEQRKHMEELARSAPVGTNDPNDINAKRATASHSDYVILNERRMRITDQWREFFESYDVLLCPVAATPAFPHDHSEPMGERQLEINGQQRPYWDNVFWAGFSLVSFLPASVVPAGRTKANLPVGVQIVGPYLEDNTTLAVAKMLEQQHRAFEPPPGFEA